MLLRVGGVRWLGSLLILWSGILDVGMELSNVLSLPIMSVQQGEEPVEVYGIARRIFHLLDWREARLRVLVR